MFIDVLLVIGDGMERVMLVHATVAQQYQAMDGSLFFLGRYSDDSKEYQTDDEYKSFHSYVVCCYDVEYDQLIELELLQLDRVALVASV